MIINNNIQTNIKINKLEDLKKLKPLMEVGNLKVNKSQIDRELEVDVRTVGKYINRYKRKRTRNRTSRIDKFCPIINDMLSQVL